MRTETNKASTEANATHQVTSPYGESDEPSRTLDTAADAALLSKKVLTYGAVLLGSAAALYLLIGWVRRPRTHVLSIRFEPATPPRRLLPAVAGGLARLALDAGLKRARAALEAELAAASSGEGEAQEMGGAHRESPDMDGPLWADSIAARGRHVDA